MPLWQKGMGMRNKRVGPSARSQAKAADMVVKLLLLQNFLLLRAQQVEVGVGGMLMNIGRIQAVAQAPFRQPLAVGAPYLGDGADGGEPGVCPVVGQEGDLPAGDRFFPMLKLRALHAEGHWNHRLSDGWNQCTANRRQDQL